ncbi:MAG: cupin domain-containing protein [Fusobacteriaceae bacterium]|jgi:mannose-6-phosphate isomerase-like protein (cupin superfamily)|nr:cupin domain-containing protein [Fusobacteriaceae bacterium]
MKGNIIEAAKYVNHPSFNGVFTKHFFSSEDNDRLNNVEVVIMPNFEITPHIHETAIEFFYVVEGEGEFLDNTEWRKIEKGVAFKAPIGMTHGIKNTGKKPLVLFSTFSPSIR